MKKVITLLSVIITFVVLPCCILYKLGATFYLDKFFLDQIIPLMGTILALNFALIAAMQTFLLNIEKEFEQEVFCKTRNEINSNIVAMLIIFILCFILQCVDLKMPRIIFYLVMATKLTLFFTYIYIIYDLSSALFKVIRKK